MLYRCGTKENLDPTVVKVDELCFGQVGRVFANGPGYRDSIPGRVMPTSLKMVLDTSLFHTQHYKVWMKDKVQKSWEKCSALPYTTV